MNIGSYEERFVAFIDLLGFKELIYSIENKSETHENDFAKVKSILNFLYEESIESNGQHDLPIYVNTEKGIIEKELGDPRCTYVSDCIIISTEGSFDGFKSLCNKVTKFSTDIACDGIFIRGAITYGNVFHTKEFLFGSAYQRAYLLESEKACVPRVIIDDKVFEKLKENIGIFPLREPTICKDKDDIYYLCNFPYQYHPVYTPSWLDFLLRIKSHILYNLNIFDLRVSGFPLELKKLDQSYCWKENYTFNIDFTGGSEKVLGKYLWLKDEFNKTLEVESHKSSLSDNDNLRIVPIQWKDEYWGPVELLGKYR